jgi:hypothetical protein
MIGYGMTSMGKISLGAMSDEKAFQKAEPVLKTFGRNVIHLGPIGWHEPGKDAVGVEVIFADLVIVSAGRPSNLSRRHVVFV